MIRIVGLMLTASSLAQLSPAQTPSADPVKATFLRVCSGCHETDVATGARHSRKDWEAIVGQMIDIGAPASDAEFSQIVDYLSANYGTTPAKPKVNVNTATAKELADVLGLTSTESDAIVAYRTKNGKFASVDDVKKVQGVDPAKLEAAKDRMTL
jgi:competence protein ComEA